MAEYTNIARIVRVFVEQIQAVEDAAHDMLTLRDIDTIEGAQLDAYGQLLNEQRGGRTDSEYRLILKVLTLLTSSHGEAELILTAAELMTDPAEVQVYDEYPAKIIVNIADPGDLTAVMRYLRKFTSAGVKMSLLQSPAEGIFQCATGLTSETDADTGFSDDTQVTGGQLSQYIE